MGKMQKLVFIPHHKWSSPETRGSSIMRACIVSSYMKENYGHLIDVRYSRSLPADFSKNDIVIFVKDHHHPDVINAKRKGCIVVYDPIDDQKVFRNNDFDLMIASCDSHALILAKRHSIDIKRIICIDQFHTNIFRKKAVDREKEDVVVIGSVTPESNSRLEKNDYLSLVDFKDTKKVEVKEFCDLRYSLTKRWNEVNELYGYFYPIHVGLALYDPKKEPWRCQEKHSTKLSAFASYSIPTVLFHQDSYCHVINFFPELSNYVVFDMIQAKKVLRNLVLDFDYYVYSKKLFEKIGEFFHIKNCYTMYVEQINNAISMK